MTHEQAETIIELLGRYEGAIDSVLYHDMSRRDYLATLDKIEKMREVLEQCKSSGKTHDTA